MNAALTNIVTAVHTQKLHVTQVVGSSVLWRDAYIELMSLVAERTTKFPRRSEWERQVREISWDMPRIGNLFKFLTFGEAEKRHDMLIACVDGHERAVSRTLTESEDCGMSAVAHIRTLSVQPALVPLAASLMVWNMLALAASRFTWLQSVFSVVHHEVQLKYVDDPEQIYVDYLPYEAYSRKNCMDCGDALRALPEPFNHDAHVQESLALMTELADTFNRLSITEYVSDATHLGTSQIVQVNNRLQILREKIYVQHERVYAMLHEIIQLCEE